MANHKSAEKRARQTKRRTAVNTARRSRVRGSIKKVEEAIKTGDQKAAQVIVRLDIARGHAGDGGVARQVHRIGDDTAPFPGGLAGGLGGALLFYRLVAG